jgi:hypothetical protein
MRKFKMIQALFVLAAIASFVAAAKGVGHGGGYGFSGGLT